MIREHDVAALLSAAADDIAVPTAPAEALARVGRQTGRRRRTVSAAAATTALGVIAVGVALTVGSRRSAPIPALPPSATDAPRVGCLATVPDAVLPGWARAGFSDPKPRIAYVRGGSGDIVAILFAQPLTAPPAADHNNKILWVSRLPQDPVSSLRINARLIDGSSTAERTVPGGPGPSIIDLPVPGCWHLTLHWSGHTDSLNLAYLPE